MVKKIIYLFLFLIIPLAGNCQTKEEGECLSKYRFDGQKLVLSKQEWKERLTPEEFYILRQGGTEYPFTSPLDDNKKEGIYRCVGCSLALFSSASKFDSGTGWPSFWEPICSENVTKVTSYNPFASGNEVVCSRCDGHLGHVFPDGPEPTGLRYCINGVILKFEPAIID